jgi:hypothetical protein
MRNELQHETHQIAVRLQSGKDDVVTRAWAEQDLRALCIGYAIRGLYTAGAAVLRACVSALSHARLGEGNRPALH